MGKSVPYERTVQVVRDVARALDYAHGRGVVHRDIKPSNILTDERGEVLLTDFGIAKMVEGSTSTQLTAAGSVLGTPAYMSPEQAQGQMVDGRSDIYSLGVVLYELLTGRPPYEAETPFAIVLKHINEPLPPPRGINPNIPEALERVVLKAMAKDPDQRFETAGQMAEVLQDALKEAESTLVVPGPAATTTDTLREVSPDLTPQKSKQRSIGPLLIGGGLVVLLLCLLAGGGLVVLGLVAYPRQPTAGATPTAAEADVDNSITADPDADSVPEPTSDVSAQSLPNSDEEDQIALPVDGSGSNAGIDLDSLEGDLLFADEFEADENRWFTGQDSDEFGDYSAEISDGLYKVVVTSATEDGNFIYFEPSELILDNFIYAVDFAGSENEGEFAYGLNFRGSSTEDHYLFEIDNEGFIVLLALADADWEVPIDYTESSAITPNGPNQLMVKAVGSSLTFFINGEEVAALEDDVLEAGSIGLAVDSYDEGGEVLVSVDRVMVRELSDDMPPAEDEVEAVIAFAEYFDSDANGWSTGEFENEFSRNEVKIEDGTYTLTVETKPDKTPYVEKMLPNQEFSNFILSVEATPLDAAEHYSYGLVFRENAVGHTYTFEIGNDGLYGIFIFENEWMTLKDWSSSAAIKVGQTNELTVVAEDESLTFFVNEEELTTIEDSTLAEGKIGLLIDMFEADSSATVDFDNLIVTALP
jgi:regulator of RNase E activity RraB